MGRPPHVIEFKQLQETTYENPLSPTERKVLLHVAEAPGKTASEISEISGLTPDATSRAFKKLYSLRLVRSHQDPQDRRFVRYGLTQAGYDDLLAWASMRHGREIRKIEGVTIWEPEQ